MKIFVLRTNEEQYGINRLEEESKKLNIDLNCYNPNQFDIIVTKDDRKSILLNGELASLPDFIIPRMGASTSYYGLAVIRHFERLGIVSINNSNSIEIVKDKLYSTQILSEDNIPSPKTMLVKHPVPYDIVEKYLKLPVVVKLLNGTQGKGVYLINNKLELIDLMEMLEEISPNTNIIMQEFIEHSRGRDLRVFVIGGRIIGCMERTSNNGDFKANFSRGGSVKPFDITSEIEQLSLESTKIFGLDIAGVDLLFDKDGFKVCEVNSSPGFEGLEMACNVNVPQEIFEFLKLKYKK